MQIPIYPSACYSLIHYLSGHPSIVHSSLLLPSMSHSFGESYRVGSTKGIHALTVFCSWDYKVTQKRASRVQQDSICIQLKVSPLPHTWPPSFCRPGLDPLGIRWSYLCGSGEHLPAGPKVLGCGGLPLTGTGRSSAPAPVASVASASAPGTQKSWSSSCSSVPRRQPGRGAGSAQGALSGGPLSPCRSCWPNGSCGHVLRVHVGSCGRLSF